VRAAAVTGCASLLSALAVAGATPGLATAAAPEKPLASAASHNSGNGCHLGNGVKHVVELGFDNVHFFRDNPNVPSDLQMMPNLLNFFTSNGTFLSNNHTPLIAHTADDLLTTWTGLYGDRAGMPVSNSFQAYNADGTTDPATSFAYWTDPIFDTAKTPKTRGTTPARRWCTRPPRPPPPPRPPGRTPPPPRRGCRSPGPAATWATWPR
jgi:hypothetical protein